jgi:hypothetical protein
MGRRKNRKQERRQRQGGGASRAYDLAPPPIPFDPPAPSRSSGTYGDDWGIADYGRALAPAKSCGGCREFVEDQEGGRGTCLHPGSGILSPWTDTPACAFHHARR